MTPTLTVFLLAGVVALALAVRAYVLHRKRLRARDRAEINSWKPLPEYVATADHPESPTRWATKSNRGP